MYKNNVLPNGNNGVELIGQSNTMSPQMKMSLALNQRKVFLLGEITEDSIFECMYYIYKIISIDKIIEEKLPIEIVVNSIGGSVYDGLSLISLIDQLIESGYNVKTVNVGKAFSMGFVISICGSERISYKYSRYMIHDISAGTIGTLDSMMKDIEEYNYLRNTVYDIISKKTKITIDQLSEWHEKKIDKFFSAEEALQFGLIDKII